MRKIHAALSTTHGRIVVTFGARCATARVRRLRLYATDDHSKVTCVKCKATLPVVAPASLRLDQLIEKSNAQYPFADPDLRAEIERTRLAMRAARTAPLPVAASPRTTAHDIALARANQC